jgi:multiple sugar transport system permease protein
MSALAPPVAAQSRTAGTPLRRPMRRFLAVSGVTLFASVVVSAFLMPLAYMAATALKQEAQISAAGAPLFPAVPDTFEWEGRQYPVYSVPTEDGVHS